MNKLSALFVVAFGIQSFGCVEESSLSSNESDDGEEAAEQQAPGDVPLGRPAPSGQIDSVVQASLQTVPGSVAPPVGTKVVPVRVANITGTGCSRELTAVKAGSVFADSIELEFDEDFFKIIMPKSPSGAVARGSLNCVIELRVRGIAGVEAAVHQVQYRGNSNLPASARGRIESRITWRDDEFDSDGAADDFVRKGPVEGAWFFDHQVDLKAKAARSRCFTSDQEEDIAYIELTSTLENSNKTWDASFDVTHTRALALDTEPSDERQAPVEYRVSAVPCTR